MKHRGRIIAVSLIMFFHTGYLIYYLFRDGKLDVVDLFGYPIFFGIAYWAGKQYDKATFFSEKDPLTGLYNRRFVLNVYNKLTSLTERADRKLFVILIDCDNFKEINDNYSHSIGDMVLKNIADALVAATRNSDIIARWGGDEFLIVGQYKNDRDIEIISGKLEDKLDTISQNIDIPVRVSIGSALSMEDMDLFELIKISDKRMYERKIQKKQDTKHLTPLMTEVRKNCI